MYMKRYEVDDKIIIAVCDMELMGKEFREGELTLKIEEGFYKGIKASDKEVAEALGCATIANIAGEKAIACAVECGCIDADTIIFINGVPHAQMIQI